ncbi:hypothetical protein BLA29_014619 [Euroglyphus maynei]|uniref:Uncharacterized protein n=1 Tax=Euroglyphus maynei TaxID=6958 RepID=A0A1Y3ARU7_EURMA|nr:hypothetical protein BLA29_014619 [Euroglyphus maynei]
MKKQKKKGKNDLIQVFVTVPDGHCNVNINIESIIIVNDRPNDDLIEELIQLRQQPKILDPKITVWTQ